jgi:hypothetical protein
MNEPRPITYRLDRSPQRRAWTVVGGNLDGLLPRSRSDKFYRTMIGTMRPHAILGNFRKVLDIGQDEGESMMWLSRISEKVTGLDIDTRTIELTQANMRMSDWYHSDRHTAFVLPEKSLIDIDDPVWHDVDLIKIDAGSRTLFVLEALEEVIDRNEPLFFIVHGPDVDHDQIWDHMIRRHHYFAEIMKREQVEDLNPLACMIAYSCRKEARRRAKEKEKEAR